MGRPKNNGLLGQERIAADHYIAHGNQTEAYRMAYPGSRRWKQGTAARRATALFKRPAVAAYVKAAQDAATSAAVLTRQEALELLSAIARGDLSRVLTEAGDIDPEKVAGLGPALQDVVLQHGEYGSTRKIKIRDPIAAIERLSKMLGWDKTQEISMGTVVFNLDMTGKGAGSSK